MAASDLTSIAYIVKKLYGDKQPENLASRKRAFLSMVRKEGGFTGSNLTVPVQYGNPMGVSATFSTAQTNAASTKGIAWTLTRSKKYGVCTLDAETIQATKDNKGAFVSAIKNEVDSMVDEVGHRLAIDLYGSGSGSIGQRASASTNVITLAVADNVKNFSVGMTIVAGPNDSSTSLRSGSTTITSIDEDAGTITLASAASITSFADNDYLFMQGDPSNALTGLAGWLPLTSPSPSESFFGVDRSVDVGRLSGWKVNATSNSIEENALTLAAKINRGGGQPDALLLNPTNWMTLSKSLGTKVLRDQGGSAVAGFEYITIATSAGMVKVFADPETPANRGYMLQMDTWYLRYLGPGIPHIVMDDGLESLRQSTADGVEIRGRYWGQLYTNAPGRNGVFAI